MDFLTATSCQVQFQIIQMHLCSIKSLFPFILLGGFLTNSIALTEWLKYVEKASPINTALRQIVEISGNGQIATL